MSNDITEGIYGFYKPKGISSYDVIRNIKKRFPRGTKIGHGGTLDPLADGVLVIAIGKDYTKKLQVVLKDTKKEYVTTLQLGYTSTTDDAEGDIKPYRSLIDGDQNIPTIQEISNVLSLFHGEIEQTPPIYSALKIDGVPAYKRARRGESVVMKSRKAMVYSISIVEYSFPELILRVETGSGVYVRALGRDIGEKLDVGAYLTQLTRTSVGPFMLDNAIHLDDI